MEKFKEQNELTPGSTVIGVVTKDDTKFVIEIEVGSNGTKKTPWELLEKAGSKIKAQSCDLIVDTINNTNPHAVSLIDELIIRYRVLNSEDDIELTEKVEDTPQGKEVKKRKNTLIKILFG